MANHELPMQCRACMGADADDEFDLTDQEILNCSILYEVPPEFTDQLPCATREIYLGGPGQFQNLNEAQFNNRGAGDPNAHIPQAKYLG